MKNFTKLFALAVVILGFSATSFGQNSRDSYANAQAEVKSGISITKPSSGEGSMLNFGAFFTDGTAAALVVDKVAGPQTATSVNTGCVGVAAAASACKFTLSNVGGALAYDYSFDPTVIVSSAIAGNIPMTVTLSSSLPTGLGSLNGTQIIYIGGSLGVNPAQGIGTYSSGSPFKITVSWN